MNTENVTLLIAATLGLLAGAVARRGKTQPIRVLDVLVVGPLVITAGVRPQAGLPFRAALVFTGAATITFNGGNFLAVRREMG